MWIWIYMRISCESPHHLWVLHFRLSHCGYCTESHVCMSWYAHTYICAYVCMYRLYHLQLWSAKVHVALCIIVWLCNICMYLVIICMWLCVKCIHSGSGRYARCYSLHLTPAKEGVVVGTECRWQLNQCQETTEYWMDSHLNLLPLPQALPPGWKQATRSKSRAGLNKSGGNDFKSNMAAHRPKRSKSGYNSASLLSKVFYW